MPAQLAEMLRRDVGKKSAVKCVTGEMAVLPGVREGLEERLSGQ
jgi:hypothetical protein